jgi:hypothetical protein
MESPVSLDPSAISLVPALRDAQKAAKEVASIRREEDVAVEKGLKEVLAWASTHRPKNTSRNYLPKQREWRASYTFHSSSFPLSYGSIINL